MAQAIGLLIYLFTICMAFVILWGLPLAFVLALWKSIRLRTVVPIIICILIMAGFVTGGALGWWLRPFEWNMPLIETFQAGVDSETYGHDIESQAERVALYVLFTSEIGLLAAGGALLIWRRRRQSVTVSVT